MKIKYVCVCVCVCVAAAWAVALGSGHYVYWNSPFSVYWKSPFSVYWNSQCLYPCDQSNEAGDKLSDLKGQLYDYI